jgi:hypothetical protein
MFILRLGYKQSAFWWMGIENYIYNLQFPDIWCFQAIKQEKTEKENMEANLNVPLDQSKSHSNCPISEYSLTNSENLCIPKTKYLKNKMR